MASKISTISPSLNCTTGYRAPLEDMRFLIELFSELAWDDMDTVLEQAAKFVEQEMLPANAEGDRLGCKFENGSVRLPPLTKQTFKGYVDGGWMGINLPEEYGGQNLPHTIGAKVSELLTSTNNAISMIPALTISACKALLAFGSDQLKSAYLPKMIAGTWTGTMCMTEAHCGSDLGLIKTSAAIQPDGSYRINGSKVFISAGEHDASDNIIHLVLARIPSAPKGTKGLSLFLVPKYLPAGTSPDASLTNKNSLSCIGIEEKMGIHANPTCSIVFESATGFLVGEENQGMKAMFTMMNEMRLGTALQGVGLSEHAYQVSLNYAGERSQGKALDKRLTSDSKNADLLIRHADIRRMILSQKAFAEGGRALCHFCAELLDSSEDSFAPQQPENDLLLGLLTPIAKAFLTETGLESAQHAIQIYGGHGYIREHGVEQLYRDGRISTLYEGTTGIQALDLLGRKVLGDQAKALLLFTKKLYQLSVLIDDDDSNPKALRIMAQTLKNYAKEWPQLAQKIGLKAMSNHDEVGAAAYDFLMYSGYVSLAYFWLNMANQSRFGNENFSPEFLENKIRTAQFYFARILPKAQYHRTTLLAGAESLHLKGKPWKA